MVISGAFAGLGGALYNMGPVGQVVAGSTFQGFGYMGIAVALIGANTAVGSLLGALLFGFLGVLTPQFIIHRYSKRYREYFNRINRIIRCS